MEMNQKVDKGLPLDQGCCQGGLGSGVEMGNG